MRYTPERIPFNADAKWLVEYLTRELNKISQVLDHPEATTINFGKEVRNIASSAYTNINWKRGQKQRLILDADTIITYTHPEGVCNLMLVLEYNDVYTPTLPCFMHWTGGVEPTWTSTPGAVDVIDMYYDGTNYHATASLDSKSSCVIPV